MSDRPHPHTIWVDVEDLFRYFDASPQPSGIQRLVFEIICLLPERARGAAGSPRIVFVRHGGFGALPREVSFDSVARLFERRERQVARAGSVAAASPRSGLVHRLRQWLIGGLTRLPPAMCATVLQAGVHQLNAARYTRRLVAVIRASMGRRAPAGPGAGARPDRLAEPAAAGDFAGQPGDVFLVLGAAWVTPGYGALLQRLRAQYQLRPVLLLYDLIPLRRPEWCAADLASQFAAWLRATLPQCHRLLAISRATAEDVQDYAAETGLALPGGVLAVPIGTGLGRTARLGVAGQAPPRGLPPPGSYVLFVSTLEARKNHALLFRVWRRLLAELPRDQVPTLVFAGRVGWLVADLMQQLENTSWLDGKIRLLRDPSDAELMALYRGCRFTLFPSLFEGWGLPVSESLALGRPCIASNRTSLPEAGGTLARYFDPEDIEEATRVIRSVIEDPAGLAAWRERVAREFRHVAWEDTADAILAACPPPGVTADAPVLLGLPT